MSPWSNVGSSSVPEVHVYLISELHNQYSGDLHTAEQMILQSKMAGAHAVKVQLFDATRLYGTEERSYLSLTYDETKELQAYAKQLRIDFFASFFDEERLEWCLKLDLPILKIASITVERYPDLCERAVRTGKRVLMSLGKWDWKTRGLPFQAPNVEYLYCVAKYPALLEDIDLPDFRDSAFVGFSDHTIGTAASLYAIARGAQVIEKHFTLGHELQKSTEQAHAGGMTFGELAQIRVFSDAADILGRKGAAFRRTALSART
jgi:sialic acid synthase SpsE